jgi:succinate dehydrogenase / fumarate reductase cytochrome b subunit
MAGVQRPLSPHLQVYRPQISSVLSITHRITGASLGFGTLLLAWWLISAATGAEAFAQAQSVLGSIPGLVVLFGFTWALFYHLCNGIRHLGWDAGYGFDIPVMERTGIAVIVVSIALTATAWAVGCTLAAGVA